MKRIGLLLGVLFLAIQINIANGYIPQQGVAEVKFDKTVHDFGKIKKGAKDVKIKFKYTNTGSDMLFITRVVKSCGCTEPVYSKEPLMPGQSADFEVGYTTTDIVGVFNKKLTVFTNAETESVILTIKGEVLPE
jgi:hypothetical protein